MTDRPIFVVGAPRNGTTLTRDVLNRHPDVYLLGELHFFEVIWDARSRLGDPEDPEVLARALDPLRKWLETVGDDRCLAPRLDAGQVAPRQAAEGGGYRGLLAALGGIRSEIAGVSRWGDSTPQDVLYIPQILEWFPDARIVGVARDPRAFLSSYKNLRRRGLATYRERYNPITNSVLWRGYMRALLAAREGPQGSAVHVLRYEDLVDDPETTVRALCRHVELDYRPEMLDVAGSNTSFERADAALRRGGIDAGSRDRWRKELSPTEVWVGERVFGPVMRAFGYEPVSGRFPPRPLELLGIAATVLPRLVNMLFRGTGKPVTAAKIRRVLSSFRGG